MRIGLFSECHYGITDADAIRSMLIDLRDIGEPDILVNCGDDCGSFHGHEGVTFVAKTCREIFDPAMRIIHVMGNHDYWCGRDGKFGRNLKLIRDAFETYGIESLDTLGVSSFGNVTFFGNSGWYNHPNPPTNDRNFLPSTYYKRPINEYLLRLKNGNIARLIDTMESVYWKGQTRVFVSHFPVIAKGDDWKGAFAQFSWDAKLGDHLRELGVTYFLNGHAHQSHNGPLRYESGSDYGRPNYRIIEI